MAILKIVKEGDETLRKVCRPIGEVTPRVVRLLDDMLETMYEADGVGLAGPQIGVLRRIVVVDTGETGPIYMINPEIIASEGEQDSVEGCLSIPGKYGIVKRPEKVTVRAIGRDGKPYEIVGEGFEACAFCHEIDHLDGTLYPDKAIRMLTPEELEKLREG